ncbi:MAG: hypothetical protein IJU27_05595 [Bacteroidales bacterium]|nr:hypothetical protein [Bacteroidales bacterium]
MKTFDTFLAAAALLAGLCACTNLTPDTVEIDAGEAGTGNVTFTIAGPSLTKGTSDAFENTIHDLQIGVYRESGLLVAYGSAQGSSPSVTLNVPVGGTQKHFIRAYVNGSSLNMGSYPTIGQLLGSYTNLLSNRGSGVNALEMMGGSDTTVLTANSVYAIPVRRCASKVEIDTIKNAVNTNADIKIEKIYLINVNKRMRYDWALGAEVYDWGQKMRYDASETALLPFTAEVFPTPVSVSASSPHTTKHYFYCYANKTTSDSSSSTWSPRFTRLVVEATYNGEKCYYPINIVGSGNSGLSPGKLYRITSLKITGPGSTSPDQPLQKGSITVNMTVTGWEQGFNSEVTI